MNLCIRGYRSGKLEFADQIKVDEIDDLESLARQHVERLAGTEPFLLEIEFLDESDPNERFFRFGTDPTRMVQPIGFKL